MIKMHVLLLSNEYPPFIFGGIGTFMESLARGLSRIGVKVTVISGYPASHIIPGHHTTQAKFFQVKDRLTIVRFPYPNLPPRFTMFQIANFKKIRQTIEDVRPDIIHGQSSSTFPASCALKGLAPILVTFHTSPQTEKAMSASSLLRGGSWNDFTTYLVGYPAWHFTFKKELQHSDAAVAVSRSLRSEILTEMGQKYADKMTYIHNGVDLQSLDRVYEEAGKDVLESNEKILFAGRLYWRKGALNIIKMAYLLQRRQTKFKVIVHGAGPLFNKMRQCIRSLNLQNIELKGFVTRSKLMRSLKECKFVAIPSIYEACPMILLESMCLGKIPLMLRLPFSSELTKDGEFGILGHGIKDLIDRLLESQGNHSSSQLSSSIRCFARKEYDINKTLGKYISLFNNIARS